jgi:hypothetical protein
LILKGLKDGSHHNILGVAEAILKLQAHDQVVAQLKDVQDRLTNIENKINMAGFIRSVEREKPRAL